MKIRPRFGSLANRGETTTTSRGFMAAVLTLPPRLLDAHCIEDLLQWPQPQKKRAPPLGGRSFSHWIESRKAVRSRT